MMLVGFIWCFISRILLLQIRKLRLRYARAQRKRKEGIKKFSRIMSIWYQINALAIDRDEDLEKRFKFGYTEFSS